MTADYGEDPQLKLLLLSQRLTSLKRQRAYNLTDIVGETESPNNMDADLGNEFGEEEKEDHDDDEFMWKPFGANDAEDNVKFTNNTEECFEGERDGEHFDMNSLQRKSSGDVFTGEYVDIDKDFVARRSINSDLHFHKVEGEDDDDDEDVIDFKALAISKHSRIDKPETECSKTGVGFSRIADYYRYPEFLHDVTSRKAKDNDNDCPTGIVGESGEEEAAATKRNASSDERNPLPTKKSASNMKSTRKLKSGLTLKQKLKQTLSGRLLEISDDVTPSSDAAIARMDTLFHQCVCTLPWRCKYSTLAPRNSPADVDLNEGGKKVWHGGSGTGNQIYGRGDLTGWSLPRSERGTQYGGGRKVSSARDSNRRRKYDPFIHRNISDSSKYTFKVRPDTLKKYYYFICWSFLYLDISTCAV